MVDELLLFASRLNEIPLGPLNPSISMAKWLEHVFRKHLSNDSHQLANGRLGVAVTRLLSSKKTMVTEYHSKEDLVQVSVWPSSALWECHVGKLKVTYYTPGVYISGGIITFKTHV